MQTKQRQFLKVCVTTTGSSSLAAMGFSPNRALAEVREFKLSRATETRNTCPYCSVGYGLLVYSLGDSSKNTPAEFIHFEGNPDHPVNHGTLCPKGAGLLDFIHSPNRLKYPEYRAPGSKQWQRLTWNEAFNRIAVLMKQDQDTHFIIKNDRANCQPLNFHRFPRGLCFQQRNRLPDPQFDALVSHGCTFHSATGPD